MQVRSLCVAPPGLFTGSRDKTIKLWKEQEGQLELALDATYVSGAGGRCQARPA